MNLINIFQLSSFFASSAKNEQCTLLALMLIDIPIDISSKSNNKSAAWRDVETVGRQEGSVVPCSSWLLSQQYWYDGRQDHLEVER